MATMNWASARVNERVARDRNDRRRHYLPGEGPAPTVKRIKVRNLALDDAPPLQPVRRYHGVSYVRVGGVVVDVVLAHSSAPDVVCANRRDAIAMLDEMRAGIANDN